MVTTQLSPHQLFKRVRSSRISVYRRLRALSMMARDLDEANAALVAQADVARQDAALAPTQIADLLNEASKIVHAQLLPRLRYYRLRLANLHELTEPQQQWLQAYFQQRIYPLLTPLAVDPGRPFPKLAPGRLYLLVVLQTDGKFGGEREVYGLVKMSNRMPRLVRAQGGEGLHQRSTRKRRRDHCCLLWREDVIRYFIGTLFSGMKIKGVYQFRFVCVPEADAAGPPKPIDKPRTVCAPVLRVDVEAETPSHLVQWLVDHLQTSLDRVLYCERPLGMADLCELADYLTLMRGRQPAVEGSPAQQH